MSCRQFDVEVTGFYVREIFTKASRINARALQRRMKTRSGPSITIREALKQPEYGADLRARALSRRGS